MDGSKYLKIQGIHDLKKITPDLLKLQLIIKFDFPSTKTALKVFIQYF